MKEIFLALEKCLKTNNWYAALILALTLPDICSKHHYKEGSSFVRYADWFDEYVGERYKSGYFKKNLSPELQEAIENSFNFSDFVRSIAPEIVRDHEERMAKLNKEEVWLSGADCYALRCTTLHEGRLRINKERLNSFHFVTPRAGGNIIHCNINPKTGVLQLQIDIFANDILEGAIRWWSSLNTKQKALINSDIIKVHAGNIITF